MKSRLLLVPLLLWFPSRSVSLLAGDACTDTVLRYDEPADMQAWPLSGIPLGNGMIGAMCEGRADREAITINHGRLRPALYREQPRPVDPSRLARLRTLYLDGKGVEAQAYFKAMQADAGCQKKLNDYPLYPGALITRRHDPRLLEAAIKALQKREAAFQPDAVSFSYAWPIALYARAGNGNQAYRNLTLFCQAFLTPDNLLAMLSDQSGGQLARTKHDKMIQIESGLGVTAAIAEMLLQSHEGFLRILPALPDALPHGQVRGLCARGGFEVDLAWRDRGLKSLQISSRNGGVCRVKLDRTPAAGMSVLQNGSLVAHQMTADGLIEFPTSAGKRYDLTN